MRYKDTIKRVAVYLLAFLLLMVLAVSTQAATRKKISKVVVSIKADIQVDTKVGTERRKIQKETGNNFLTVMNLKMLLQHGQGTMYLN